MWRLRSWVVVLCLVPAGIVPLDIGVSCLHGSRWEASAAADEPPPLQTVAERSEFRATSKHDEVVAFCKRLTELSPRVRYQEFGKSVEGRPLGLLTVADPPVKSPSEALRSEKAIVLLFANIHGGEVDGKEGVLMIARDLALAKDSPDLKNVVLLVVPNLNPDGNERIDRGNRTEQLGPAEGVGIRENAQGLDLNRDYVKLESPEIRALVQLTIDWKPHLIVDCHTTNGSWHRHTMTYDVNRHLASDPRLIQFAHETLVPNVTKRLEQLGGWKSFFYGNFRRDHSDWETFPLELRFGTHYFAARQRVAVLSESYSYASYRDRVMVSRDFCRSLVEFAAGQRESLIKAVSSAERAGSTEGKRAEGKRPDGKASRQVALRSKAVPLPGTFQVLGWKERDENGKSVKTDEPADYPVTFLGGAEATVSVTRPAAYLFHPKFRSATETLQRHGITVEELREELDLDVELYRVDKLQRATTEFQKHRTIQLDATVRRETMRVPAGWLVVRTANPLGDLATVLLEPLAEDGLATWNFFDESLTEGHDYPIVRLPEWLPLLTSRLPPPSERRRKDQPITMAALYDGAPGGEGEPHRGGGINLSGAPSGGITWTPSGDAYLQNRDGQLHRIEAATGRMRPFLTESENIRKALAALPALGEKGAAARARISVSQLNPDHTGAFFEHENDLYFVALDGSRAVRLTATPQREELTSFSPDGRFVAFVRDNDLYVVDVATSTERRLTTDGNALVTNGKADWVYFEELFNRRWQAYWWSPDSRRIAFLHIDDAPVHKFAVLDPIPPRQKVEMTAYPKAGDPLPHVELGCVTVAGGDPVYADLSEYSLTDRLIARAGFTPDGSAAYAYLLNRKQTWLDVLRISPDDGQVKRLFRETTKAWVDDHGPLEFLGDGSFLFSSERDGYRHFYRYAADGKLLNQVTSGPWEARTLHRIDEAGGWVYLSGSKDNALGSNLFRVKLDGSAIERMSEGPGTHQISLGKKGAFYVDSRSSRGGPTQVGLKSLDGGAQRTLDTNPVYALEEYKRGAVEAVEIPASDGFTLDGQIIFPPDFDPQRAKKYPVWVKTYGGPHAPTVRDAWMGGHVEDHAHAAAGFIVFHIDPRPASGKSALSAWTSYRQLGKQELADLETAVRWLAQRPYIDAQRVGLSGYSYGGYLTSYALTHSKLFAAGVAGAPVTDWRNYDAIYTERYMDTPQENPEGYKASSVVAAAGDLHGKLLLIHGVMDDNVHLQNSLQLLGALQAADKYCELQLYPRARHGVGGKHFPKLAFEFMVRHLQP